MGRFSQRTDDVLDRISHVERPHESRGFSYHLKNERDGSSRRIRARHGQRNPFSGFVDSEDDKLAGFGFSRNTRRFDPQLTNRVFGHLSFFNNLIQLRHPFPKKI
jgi:hypothetical protein